MPVQPLSFPYRLHKLLNESESEGFEEIVSWLPEPTLIDYGTRTRLAFRVHKPKEFANSILLKYFPHCKQYRSFQRQLNIWCFERVEDGPHKGAYHHELFRKNQPSLCKDMVRIKVKKDATARLSLTRSISDGSNTSYSSSCQTSPDSMMENHSCNGGHQQNLMLQPPTQVDVTLLHDLQEFKQIAEQLRSSGLKQEHILRLLQKNTSCNSNDNIFALQPPQRRNSFMMISDCYDRSAGEEDFFEGKRFFHPLLTE